MSQRDAKLVLDRLSFQFGDELATDSLSLKIPAGEFLALLGPSGCGKTTALRLIAGLLTPSAGTIMADGKEISSASRVLPAHRRGMSMIFQNYALWPHMTVGENVAFGLKLQKAGADAMKAAVLDALETVRLASFKDRYPSELSGGQQQRVALARAIALKPSILLFDEPLSNLDAGLRDEMRDEIRRTHEAFEMTSIYVTHDQSEAMSISDRIAILNKGRLEQLDAPQDMYERPKTAFVANFLGKTNILRGRNTAEGLYFEGFSAPFKPSHLAEFAPGSTLFSIRPQHLKIGSAKIASDSSRAEGTILTRKYLGGRWEYQLRLKANGQTLWVSSAGDEVFSAGEDASIVLESSKIAVLSDPAE
jgi:ABC-type Fe3+/spermidine/putrescine transport system ATPase subunit